VAISIAGGVRPGKILEIEQRLYQQLILGKQKASPTLLDDLDRELEADANKLDVEREAVLSRLLKQIKAREVFEAISKQLIDTVNNAIEHQLASPELVLAKSDINESQILLLELLLAKNLDATRLRPLISNLGWLCRDRNWLPSGNAKLLWTTRKLWRYSIVSGIAANALAQLHNTDSALVYSGALLNQLGTSVVLSLSARLFDKTWGNWIREASSSRDKEVYDAVIATEFPAKAVFEQVLSHGHVLNWQLLELLKFENSPLTLLLKELDQTLTYRELSPPAALVARANCYAKVLLLEEMRQIEPQEKRLMFDYYELTEQEVLRLKAQNYRKLDLL